MAVDWNLEATWRKWYSDVVRAPLPNARTRVTYGRLYWRNWLWDVVGPDGTPPDYPLNESRLRVERLLANWPILTTSRILVLGAGFGFLPETFRQKGYANAWGVDNSVFIQGAITSEAHPSMLTPSVQVLNRDFRVNDRQMGNALTNLTGASTFDYVITESVVESYTAAERTAVLDAAASYLATGRPLGNIIHVVFPGWDASGDGGSPGLTLDQWVATRPAHSWASPEGNWLVRRGS